MKQRFKNWLYRHWPSFFRIEEKKVTILVDGTTLSLEGLTVKEINGDSDFVTETLGITDERAAYLRSLVLNSKENKKTDVIINASKEVKYSNELFYISFVLGAESVRNDVAGQIIIGLGGKSPD